MEEPEAVPKDKFTSAKEALKVTGPQVKGTRNPDIFCHLSNAEVHKDYDCMLNQTNIGNNNKQILCNPNLSVCRKGESGQNNLAENFVSHSWKYTLIEVDGDQDAEVKLDTVDGGDVKVKSEQQVLPCTLDEATQRLIRFIFDNDMFKEAMTSMNLDIKKMPLGKLSKQQIAKGFEALEEIEAAIKRGERNKLEELFTIIPHNFGRNRPPVISDDYVLQGKKEMLLVLADIEVAQSLKAESEKAKEEMKDMVPHPVDQNYQSLKCKLSLMDKKSKEFKAERFMENDALENRKLLWHGTNVAVVAIFGLSYFLFSCSDPSEEVFIEFDGKKVAVPRGKAIKQQQYQGSSFFNSEYLIYKESQCHIRYLLELKFGY
uniref:Poly (ADP-ribose) polymerase family, member 3 n=1 Tax=Cyprinus carpio carpio TaxID=630221 RepID=A0A9J7ZJ65_CYPCA